MKRASMGQQGRDPAGRLTVVRGGEDTLSKILRIGFATPPKPPSLRLPGGDVRFIVEKTPLPRDTIGSGARVG